MSIPQLDAITRFIHGSVGHAPPSFVRDLAKMSVVDWFAVSLAARPDPAPSMVRRQMKTWGTRGRAMNLYGDHGAPAAMSFVNGVLSHSLDFDDMHFDAAFHATGPTLAAALALGMDRGRTGMDVLNALVVGFEVGASLGEAGIGPRLLAAGWHSTGVLAHFSCASAASAMLRLSPKQTAQALGLAATQAAGLQASGGTMAKPFHVGKAAMNGVMAAELALMDMDASSAVLDNASSGLFGCLLQRPMPLQLDALGDRWRMEGNTFKPYASCQLTHAPYEAALELADGFVMEGLRRIVVHVNPLAPKVASRVEARTSMEAKFNIGYCAALGLLGYGASMDGFISKRLQDPRIQWLTRLARVSVSDDIERWSAMVELDYGGSCTRRGQTNAVLGSPGRPLAWDDLNEKFLRSTAPALGDAAHELLEVLHRFDEPDSLAAVARILTRVRLNAAG